MDVNCLNGWATTEGKKKKKKIGVLLFSYHYLYINPCCANTEL